MSTISHTVSWPSASLAMLRALALKAAGRARHLWHRIRSAITLTSSTMRSTASLTLATLGPGPT